MAVFAGSFVRTRTAPLPADRRTEFHARSRAARLVRQYCHVFGMDHLEPDVAARLQQSRAAQGKAAVANVVTVVKLRPRRANIIIVEKGRVPTSGIRGRNHPTERSNSAGCVPDMIDQAFKQEVRIIPTGVEAPRRDIWIPFRQ